MILRHGDGDFVIPELEGELAAPDEGFVLPAGVVRIGGEPWKPLRQEEDVFITLLEVLIATAGIHSCLVDDVVRPVDLQRDTVTAG